MTESKSHEVGLSQGDHAERFNWSGGVLSQCCYCLHRDTSGKITQCPAYPDGVPQTILDNALDHRNPIARDNGIRFEPKPGVAELDLQALYSVLDSRSQLVLPVDTEIALTEALDAVDRITKSDKD